MRMHVFTRQQLHALSLAFYEAHAAGFDASRVELPWPGWERLDAVLPEGRFRILDIGCGNGRLAAYLQGRGRVFDYVGTDASEALLEAGRERLTPGLEAAGCTAEWIRQDFLASGAPGEALPPGPFDAVALMGVLHHVPGAKTRHALLQAASARLAGGGVLAFTTWQFGDRPRFDKRRVQWEDVGPVLGAPIDLKTLEEGDALLRFGDDPEAPPRYCHQVSESEFESWPAALGLNSVARFQSDGAAGDLNRYWILRAHPLP